MSYIPSELLREILSRAPAEPLLRFRCVCKEWRRIIDDTSFIRSHLHRQAGGDRIILSGGKNGIELYTVSLESIYQFDGFPKSIWAEPVKKGIFRSVPHIDSLPVASCDGLILISHYKLKKFWAVWNPYTRKSIKLPPTVDEKIEPEPGRPCSGIGYDPATDDYKVVRVACYYDSIYQGPALRTFVYNLKLGYWRRLGKDLSYFRAPTGGRVAANGVFVNGALHWIANEYQNRRLSMQLIIALDLATENYRLLPLPSTLYAQVPSNTRRPTNNEIDRNLSVVDGCLFLSCNYSDLQLDGWMMMKDTNTWVLLFSFKQHESRISGHLRFLTYLKDKRLVFIQHAHNVFLWFDIDKNLSKMVALNCVPLNLTSQVFPVSLVRLNDGGHGSIAAKGRKKKKRAKDGDDASIAAKGTSRGRKRKRGLKLTLTTTS